MLAADKPRKRRVFIASSYADAAPVQKAMRNVDLDGVTLEEAAIPGTSWVDSVHRCVKDADIVVGIMGGRWKNSNVLFELGVASALNKPTLLFVTPDYPIEQIPPLGILYLRMDLGNEDAVRFGMKQVLSLALSDRTRPPAGGFTTRPIGPIADQLQEKLAQASPSKLVDLIYDAIKASGVPTIAPGGAAESKEVDFAVWSSDLEPTVANPLLVECKETLRDQTDVDAVFGRMIRALESIPNGYGIVVYKQSAILPKPASRSLPVVFVSAANFIGGLRDTGLAEYVRKLRYAAPSES